MATAIAQAAMNPATQKAFSPNGATSAALGATVESIAQSPRPPEFLGAGGEFEARGWDEDFPGSRAAEPGTFALLGRAAQSCPRISPPRNVAEWTFT